MKRSEMLSEMIKIIDDLKRTSGSNIYYFGGSKKITEEVLLLVEKLEMNPPYRKKTPEEMEQVDCINQYTYCHRWDEE